MSLIRELCSRSLSSRANRPMLSFLSNSFHTNSLKYCQHNTTSEENEERSPNDRVSPNFINRNPRNLEQMGLGWKRNGWAFQYPPVNYYHRLVFVRSNRQTYAQVEHSNGKVVLSASTKEFAIAQFLYSNSDVSASTAVGRVLAERCLESGIDCLYLHESDDINTEQSEKFQAFKTAMEEGGVALTEPEEFKPQYSPGIDYDDEARLEDLQQRQKKVANRSDLMKEYFKRQKPRRRKKTNPPIPKLVKPTYIG